MMARSAGSRSLSPNGLDLDGDLERQRHRLNRRVGAELFGYSDGTAAPADAVEERQAFGLERSH